MKLWTGLLAASLFVVLAGCRSFWGEPTDLSFIEVPPINDNTDGYVPILPPIDGLSDPVDVAAGFDDLIYVVDRGTEEIIAYDQAGRRMASYRLPGVKAVAQDRRLNLLALTETDTLIGDSRFRLDAVVRLRQYNDGVYNLSTARVVRKIVHPFYFKVAAASSDADIRFHSIAVYADNSYLVSRSGPRNQTNQFGGPDNNVLLFNANDQFLGPATVATSQGIDRSFFRSPFGLTTFAQPPLPPSNTVSTSTDFAVSLLDTNLTLQVLLLRGVQSDQGLEFNVRTDLITSDPSRADGFLYQPRRFTRPMGLAAQFGKAGVNYIFVVDQARDSVYQFSATGLEGVAPLPSASTTKYNKVSFGGRGTGPTQFNGPTAVASQNNTLYVCDRGNKRVVRFRLARDLE
jgi:hypothetical protein